MSNPTLDKTQLLEACKAGLDSCQTRPGGSSVGFLISAAIAKAEGSQP